MREFPGKCEAKLPTLGTHFQLEISPSGGQDLPYNKSALLVPTPTHLLRREVMHKLGIKFLCLALIFAEKQRVYPFISKRPCLKSEHTLKCLKMQWSNAWILKAKIALYCLSFMTRPLVRGVFIPRKFPDSELPTFWAYFNWPVPLIISRASHITAPSDYRTDTSARSDDPCTI